MVEEWTASAEKVEQVTREAGITQMGILLHMWRKKIFGPLTAEQAQLDKNNLNLWSGYFKSFVMDQEKTVTEKPMTEKTAAKYVTALKKLNRIYQYELEDGSWPSGLEPKKFVERIGYTESISRSIPMNELVECWEYLRTDLPLNPAQVAISCKALLWKSKLHDDESIRSIFLEGPFPSGLVISDPQANVHFQHDFSTFGSEKEKEVVKVIIEEVFKLPVKPPKHYLRTYLEDCKCTVILQRKTV